MASVLSGNIPSSTPDANGFPRKNVTFFNQNVTGVRFRHTRLNAWVKGVSRCVRTLRISSNHAPLPRPFLLQRNEANQLFCAVNPAKLCEPCVCFRDVR